MQTQRGIGSYSQVAVNTADQKTLIVLCYDEAIRSLKAGKECFLRKAFEEKAHEFGRAQGLISELLGALNMEAGGQIARNLSGIYTFMLKQIIASDLNEDMKAIDEVISMLSELRSAWAQIGARPAVPEAKQPVSTQTRLTGVAV